MAKADFVVDVPISFKGQGPVATASAGGGGAAENELKKLNKGVGKLNKSVLLTIDIFEIATAAIQDLFQVLKPLFKILGLMLIIAFLPLLPLMKLLIKSFKRIIEGMLKLFRGEITLGDFLKEYLGPELLKVTKILAIALGKVLFALGALGGATIGLAIEVLVESFLLLGKRILDFGLWLGDVVVQAFWNFISDIGTAFGITVEWFKNLGANIWAVIKAGLAFIGNLGLMILNVINAGLSFIGNLGQLIWNWIKSALGSIGSFFGGGSTQNDFVARPGQAPIAFSPDDTIIGVKDISKLGGGAITININKPTVRNDSDLKALANEVSRVLQRQMPGRISSG